MANKGRIRMLLSFSCFLVLMGHSYSQREKLLQGGELKDGDELVSPSGKFKFGFFTPSESPKSSEHYIGVWYYKLKDRTSQYPEEHPRAGARYYTPQFQSTKVVWIANRNTPILHKSATLRIDSSDGNLKIFPNGENPIAITSVVAARNTSVTLEQSGNLVLHELHSNGSIKGMLWQSFDYPSDTFLPGMKLGINLKTGHKWFLQSWLTDDSPALGRYTVGMDPNVTNQLTIWRRGEIKGTSGHLLNGKFNSWDASGYKFSYTSNEQEKYFSYSVSEDITAFPMLKVGWDGSLVDDRGESIGSCSAFDEYCGSDMRFRMCNSIYYSFYSSFGMMSGDGTKFRESDNMTLDDCRLKCYKNCSCVAYAATNRENDTGCEIWSRGTEFIVSNDGNSREIYVEHKGFAKKKWWKGLLIAVAVALLVILFCSLSDLARRTYKRKDNVSSYSTINNEKDQATNHELKIFNFQTIAAATDNFSTANKLGEGGFGPVYKGKLLDGREIAIKRLSRRSGQGMVEFNNEAKLIAKLQHNNLVKLVGFSLQGEERILVYEYMHNKSLDFFIFSKPLYI